MEQILITGIIAIAAAAVPQIIQALRSHSDHDHDLRRDHAARAFEYKKLRLERIREACHNLKAALDTYQRFNFEVETIQEAHSSLVLERNKFFNEIDEAASNQVDNIIDSFDSQLAAADGKLNEARSQQDTYKILVAQSVDILQLDYGALGIIEPYQDFLREAGNDPRSENTWEAYRKCLYFMIDHLRKLEDELLAPPK